MATKKVAKKKLPPPPWPDPDIVAQYADLSPDTQTVAIAIAIFGEPFHSTELQYVLKEVGARDIAGRTFSPIRARESVKKLTAIGWVETDYEDFYLVEPLVNPVLELAARDDRLRALASTYLRKASSPGIGQVAAAELLKHARLAFFTRDWNLLESLEENDNRDANGNPKIALFLFLSPTPYRELLRRLPAKFLKLAVYQIGTNISQVQSPIADFLPQAYLLVRDHPVLARFLSEILYFRGDIVRLQTIHDLLETHPSVPEAQFETKLIASSIAFLSGDDATCKNHFKEALGVATESARQGREPVVTPASSTSSPSPVAMETMGSALPENSPRQQSNPRAPHGQAR